MRKGGIGMKFMNNRNLAAEIEAQASSQSLADLAEDTNPQPQPENE